MYSSHNKLTDPEEIGTEEWESNMRIALGSCSAMERCRLIGEITSHAFDIPERNVINSLRIFMMGMSERETANSFQMMIEKFPNASAKDENLNKSVQEAINEDVKLGSNRNILSNNWRNKINGNLFQRNWIFQEIEPILKLDGIFDAWSMSACSIEIKKPAKDDEIFPLLGGNPAIFEQRLQESQYSMGLRLQARHADEDAIKFFGASGFVVG